MESTVKIFSYLLHNWDFIIWLEALGQWSWEPAFLDYWRQTRPSSSLWGGLRWDFLVLNVFSNPKHAIYSLNGLSQNKTKQNKTKQNKTPKSLSVNARSYLEGRLLGRSERERRTQIQARFLRHSQLGKVVPSIQRMVRNGWLSELKTATWYHCQKGH